MGLGPEMSAEMGQTQPTLEPEDMPGLYTAADAASKTGQTHYMVSTGARSLLAVTAAAASLQVADGEGDRPIAFVGAAAFLVALAVEAWLAGFRPERRWYDGRALAESSKTLAWRFAVGALPFPEGEPDAEARLLDRVAGLLRDAPTTGIAPTDAPVISDAMRRLRAAPLADRRHVYLRDRIDDQRMWYRSRAAMNDRRAWRWRITLLGAETLGVALAFGRAVGWLHVDVAGLIAALVTAAAAWLAVRQHEALARAYTFAHGELTIARERLARAEPEAAWAAEAADAEEAISREHTMWRASRSSSPR
jgi:hypothetical protein